ncbi:MAG: hypothetical protein MUC49_17695 [Raineya sp.]|jgi:hypothetical protein|nr:hypothetical protein [Raineya sp.]
MEDLKQIWQSYHQKLEDGLAINKQQTEEISTLKAQSFINSMKSIKIFTIIIGILWVLMVDYIVFHLSVYAFHVSIFFLVSAGIQSLITKIAIGVYVYQMYLIYNVDISHPIIKTQEQITRLQASTLWVTRILFLQLPFWTTFYWGDYVFQNISIFMVQISITAIFTYISVWLFLNIKKENKDKKWFLLIFKGKEWTPLLNAMKTLEQIENFKAEKN